MKTNHKCPKCGGDILGDGCTSVLHCEFADDDKIFESEPDANMILCNYGETMKTKYEIRIKKYGRDAKESRGGLKKIADAKPPCMSPNHKPPMHILLEPGVYEYTCPDCGETIRFEVPFITC